MKYPESELDIFLAGQAKQIHALRLSAASEIIEIGRLLVETKARCGHGNWLPWLKREFEWSERTATEFMRYYEFSKSEDVGRFERLDVSSLYLLAARSTPQKARQAVRARIEAGEVPKHKMVRQIVREALESPRPATVTSITRERNSIKKETTPQADMNKILQRGYARDFIDAYLRIKEVSPWIETAAIREILEQEYNEDRVRDFFAGHSEGNRVHSELRQMGLHPAHSHLRPVK